jgi:hypothetical protein
MSLVFLVLHTQHSWKTATFISTYTYIIYSKATLPLVSSAKDSCVSFFYTFESTVA